MFWRWQRATHEGAATRVEEHRVAHLQPLMADAQLVNDLHSRRHVIFFLFFFFGEGYYTVPASLRLISVETQYSHNVQLNATQLRWALPCWRIHARYALSLLQRHQTYITSQRRSGLSVKP